MRILVVGAGATGGYFGGRLAQAGRDVTFLVRPARAERLRAEGLQIVSPHGDVTLAPQLLVSGDIAEKFDAVLLTVKGYSLAAALDDFAAAVGPQTMVLPVLNGMGHVDILSDRFGKTSLVGGVCKVATTIDDRGRIVQLAKMQDLVYGEMDGSASARMAQLDEVMQGAGFDARLSTTIEQEMWDKWVMLATIGGITCLMRGNVGDVEAAPGGKVLALRLLDEVVKTVVALGHTPSPAFVAGMHDTLSRKGSTMNTSMYRDYMAGGPVEAEQILGDLAARAQRVGIDTPLLAASFAALSIYQANRDRAG
jgi:2-dehydropantoate 2-reductase